MAGEVNRLRTVIAMLQSEIDNRSTCRADPISQFLARVAPAIPDVLAEFVCGLAHAVNELRSFANITEILRRDFHRTNLLIDEKTENFGNQLKLPPIPSAHEWKSINLCGLGPIDGVILERHRTFIRYALETMVIQMDEGGRFKLWIAVPTDD